MSYTFDVDNKIIQLTTTDELDMLDLYSRWKEQVAGALAGAEQAFRVIKEPLAGSVFIGPYYFIMNNWQIRPFDAQYELVIAGAVVQDATSTLSPFKLDDLTNNVQIVRTVATEVQVVETVAAVTEADMDQIVDKVWDEQIDNHNHNQAKSAGKRLRQAGTSLAVEGSVSGGAPTTTAFSTDLTQTVSSFYADQTLIFLSGNLEGQARVVTAYNAISKTLTFDEPWTQAPADGDEFEIKADHVHPVAQIVDHILDEELTN